MSSAGLMRLLPLSVAASHYFADSCREATAIAWCLIGYGGYNSLLICCFRLKYDNKPLAQCPAAWNQLPIAGSQ